MAEAITSEFEAVPSPPHTNHAAERPIVIQFERTSPATSNGPRANRGIEWIHLPAGEDQEYAEHEVRVRLRYPDSIQRELNSGTFERLTGALKRLVLEHNGWIDPESDTDPPAVLPPVQQRCEITDRVEAKVKELEVTLAKALKDAKTDAAKATLQADHTKAVEKLYTAAVAEREARGSACCFWDYVDQNELILMVRAISERRGKKLNLILETLTG